MTPNVPHRTDTSVLAGLSLTDKAKSGLFAGVVEE